MSKRIRKTSVWFDQDSRTVLAEHGRLIEQRTEYKAVFSRPFWMENVGTTDVRDWCVVATDVNGDHYHGEIYHVDTNGETVVIRWPKQNAHLQQLSP